MKPAAQQPQPVQPKRRNALSFALPEQVAIWYNAKYREMGSGWITPAEELDHHLFELGLPSDARGYTLVDLGCGDGQLLMRALLSGAHCFGADLSETALAMAARRFAVLSSSNDGVWPDRLQLDAAPMEHLPYPDSYFDFAISLGSMEHSLVIEEAIAEMARVLKPGGRFLLYVPNEAWVHEDQPLETIAPSSWWIAQCEGAGLRIANDERLGDNNRITGLRPTRS